MSEADSLIESLEKFAERGGAVWHDMCREAATALRKAQDEVKAANERAREKERIEADVEEFHTQVEVDNLQIESMPDSGKYMEHVKRDMIRRIAEMMYEKGYYKLTEDDDKIRRRKRYQITMLGYKGIKKKEEPLHDGMTDYLRQFQQMQQQQAQLNPVPYPGGMNPYLNYPNQWGTMGLQGGVIPNQYLGSPTAVTGGSTGNWVGPIGVAGNPLPF